MISGPSKIMARNWRGAEGSGQRSALGSLTNGNHWVPLPSGFSSPDEAQPSHQATLQDRQGSVLCRGVPSTLSVLSTRPPDVGVHAKLYRVSQAALVAAIFVSVCYSDNAMEVIAARSSS